MNQANIATKTGDVYWSKIAFAAEVSVVDSTKNVSTRPYEMAPII